MIQLGSRREQYDRDRSWVFRRLTWQHGFATLSRWAWRFPPSDGQQLHAGQALQQLQLHGRLFRPGGEWHHERLRSGGSASGARRRLPASASTTIPTVNINSGGAFVQDDFKDPEESDFESGRALGVGWTLLGGEQPVRELQPCDGKSCYGQPGGCAVRGQERRQRISLRTFTTIFCRASALPGTS